ncbi:hypothetical protein [Rhodopirellula sp. MGV]|uniref:hypothetical protein n=1 Tax=Rhodopirellula sp. MGV TaxID=2023130 RepID=UPI000B978D2B|nr:hypothetical protein [Rhodopirellula sp. MGV]OYP34380.1 hypothetical protein CGZ80_15075 [Rhodopirellula sp. MGV]PNY37445.1 hypothetical protein C2E31_07950 [Rhodopirellula baltica]
MAKKSNLLFQTAVELSVIHASYVVGTGAPCTDKATEEKLAAPTSQINTRLASSMGDVSRFWSALFAEVAAGESLREACEAALATSGCSELQIEATAAALRSQLEDSRIALGQRFPKLQEQLKLRAGPLRDRWQTYGPGLLIETAKLIWHSAPPDGWWPESIDCLLVQPFRGGDGGFDSGSRRIWIEAMLTDPDPIVTEVVRLAYLATQVAIGRHLEQTLGPRPAIDLPEGFGSGTSRHSLLPWDLGTVPIVLRAARNLGLFSQQTLPVAKAIKLWRLGDDESAAAVERWWEQWGDRDVAMPVSLKALAESMQPLAERRKASRLQ